MQEVWYVILPRFLQGFVINQTAPFTKSVNLVIPLQLCINRDIVHQMRIFKILMMGIEFIVTKAVNSYTYFLFRILIFRSLLKIFFSIVNYRYKKLGMTLICSENHLNIILHSQINRVY